MKSWTLGSFLFWFALAILVPGIIVHFTLGRKGGHHLFDDDKLSADEIKNLPFEMARKRTVWNLQGAGAAMIGLAVVLVLYPLGCLIGLPINVFGISEQKLTFYIAAVVVLLITLGPAVYKKWRGD
jgi:hypothetical protein